MSFFRISCWCITLNATTGSFYQVGSFWLSTKPFILHTRQQLGCGKNSPCMEDIVAKKVIVIVIDVPQVNFCIARMVSEEFAAMAMNMYSAFSIDI